MTGPRSVVPAAGAFLLAFLVTLQASPVLAPQLLHRDAYVPASDRVVLLTAYYRLIRDLDFEYQRIGSLVEALAFVALQRRYPSPRYEVIPNVEYLNEHRRTLGELDLVVYEPGAGRALLIAETKLSRNLPAAGKKATEQLTRFQAHLHNGDIHELICTRSPERILRPAHFMEVGRYVRIGSQGALQAGFDYEIDLGREEANRLQQWLLNAGPSGATTRTRSALRPPDRAISRLTVAP